VIFPSPEFDDAVAEACHGTADARLLDGLGQLLAEDAAALDAYIVRTELHAALLTAREFVVPVDESLLEQARLEQAPLELGGVETERRPHPAGPSESSTNGGAKQATPRRGGAGRGAAAAILALFAGLALVAGVALTGVSLTGFDGPADFGEAIGVVSAVEAVIWMGAETDVRRGDSVRAGDKLELADGMLQIDLSSGARVRLTGPAIFEIESPLSAVLAMGRVRVTADTPESKGFTVRTRSGRIVDLGTEFVAEALPDGRCRVGVTSGEVKVHLTNSSVGQLLRAGDHLELEPGQRQVMTRIEQGDESPAFRFPTIESPSAADVADASGGRASIRCVKGRLYENPRASVQSAPPEILVDGKGQSSPDSPTESLYFFNEDMGGLHVDLGQEVAVAKVNVFSWHRCRNPGFPPDLREAHRERAAQNYVLYAHSGAEPPEVGANPAATGWTLVARVNSDEYFGLTGTARPAQQASSITSARGAIGTFRHLLFVVQPITGIDHDGTERDFSTFFGEIDVYAN